jgi:glycerol-3-phosphate acyltransferase PlsY
MGGSAYREVQRLDWLLAIPISLGAYLLGSLPTGYLVVRLVKGIDIRQVGTKNVGALNTYQQVGVWGGLLVLFVDAGKGALAVLVPGWIGAPEWVLFLTTPLVVVGHNWTVFLRFRGGKGAATIFGISLALVLVPTIITIVPVALVIFLTRNVVTGAAVGFVFLNLTLVVLGQGAVPIALCASLTLMVVVTYSISIREQLTSSIKTRQWRGLFNRLP